MGDLIIDLVKLCVAGIAGGGLMSGIVAFRRQRAEEPLTAAQVAETTSGTLSEGYRALLAEQRASYDRTVEQLTRTEQRLSAMEARLATHQARIDDLEITLADRDRRLTVWEMWHRHNLTANWASVRAEETPPPPPYPSD